MARFVFHIRPESVPYSTEYITRVTYSNRGVTYTFRTIYGPTALFDFSVQQMISLVQRAQISLLKKIYAQMTIKLDILESRIYTDNF